MSARFRKQVNVLEFIIALAVLTFLFWIGYKMTGALLLAAIWLFVKLPIACLIAGVGLLCLITLLLIPIGIKCFKLSGQILFG